MRVALALTLGMALSVFFVRAASEHGRRVNISKARGDQSGYLYDAKNIYDNANGKTPPVLIGERNRMPMYPAYLALFYHPSLDDWAFFEYGKQLNIYLAVGLLALLGAVLWAHLPPLPAVNLLGIAAFGWFIYKAGYTQSELLFYTFFFLAFLACWHLLRATPSRRQIELGALAGLLCALAYLTKASNPPFMALFAGVFGLQALWPSGSYPSGRRLASTGWSLGALAVFILVLLAVLSPYLTTNRQVFGRYFYNVNSTFYAWYDDWAEASVGVRLHGDGHRWPDVPAVEIPSAERYWREHSIGQIAIRVWSGIEDMAIVSWRTYDYLGYFVLYTGMLILLATTRWRSMRRLLSDHAWLALFLVGYFTMYFFATAFYFPISGTGTGRFLITHLLPYFFVLSHLFSKSRFSAETWTLGGFRIGFPHFHLLVLVLLVFDVSFRTYPRLMTTYGGF